MMDWLVIEQWFIEAVLFIGIGFVLAQVLCFLADLMDRD